MKRLLSIITLSALLLPTTYAHARNCTWQGELEVGRASRYSLTDSKNAIYQTAHNYGLQISTSESAHLLSKTLYIYMSGNCSALDDFYYWFKRTF